MIRVVAQHSPTLFQLVGLYEEAELEPTITESEPEGEVTYYRTQSTPRWVLYKRAVSGHGEFTFDPRQQ